MINFTSQFHLTSVDAGDKSISHRALILAAIADGVSVIKNLSKCRDVLATAECLRTLGARIELDGTTATVHPIVNPRNNVTLNCHNSGTTARLLAGLCAGLGVNATFYGDESLSKRPMQRVLEPLQQMGAKFAEVKGALFQTVASKLLGARIDARHNSAQVKSAVLLAGLFADGETTYVEKVSTRNHTENLLQYVGANIVVDGNAATVKKSVVHAFEITVPNDFSSATYLLALALISGQSFTCHNVCVNPRRTGFLRVLSASGAQFVLSNEHVRFGEKVADITVPQRDVSAKICASCALIANESDVCDAIDEVPLLATLTLAVKGKHRFCGVSELQFKESNRIEAILQMAKICRQNAAFDGTDLVVESNGVLPKHPRFDGKNDHRITMCQAVLSLYVGGGSVTNENFDVSFPAFLKAVGVQPLRFGLVGENITHSLSPTLMRHLATRANVCCSYNLFPLSSNVSDKELLSTLSSLDGANVTMPFKTRVANLLQSPLPSVNTVGKDISPTSTDGYGLVKALQSNFVDFVGKPLWVVGAGGAAEACVQALLQCGCTIQVINRTAEHAQTLTQKCGLSVDVPNPVGVLSFVPACEFEQNLSLPQSVRFVFVADYKTTSSLQLQAQKRGLTFVDGCEMLYHQGAKSFALWTGTDVQTDYTEFEKEIQNENTTA